MDARRMVLLSLYHGFTRWLPPSRAPLGRVWRTARRWTAGPTLGACGRDVNVEHGAYIGKGTTIRVGDRSGLGIDCEIHGPVTIGADVMMGPEVHIYATAHGTGRTDIPMIEQGITEPRPVVIEDDVWIGARAIILPGVRIGQGAVIGAAAVVTKDVPPYSVAAGNPARVVKHRNGLPV